MICLPLFSCTLLPSILVVCWVHVSSTSQWNVSIRDLLLLGWGSGPSDFCMTDSPSPFRSQIKCHPHSNPVTLSTWPSWVIFLHYSIYYLKSFMSLVNVLSATKDIKTLIFIWLGPLLVFALCYLLCLVQWLAHSSAQEICFKCMNQVQIRNIQRSLIL